MSGFIIVNFCLSLLLLQPIPIHTFCSHFRSSLVIFNFICNFSLMHWLCKGMLCFYFHNFLNSLVLFLLLISIFILLWSKKAFYILSIFLNILKLTVWPNLRTILEYVPCAPGKNVHTVVDGQIYRPVWSTDLLSDLLSFCVI
jgi:hypothetical protein